jgi:DNA-binding transcriptional LysR family regulator
MDAGDLRVFECVARLGGMNRAAGALNTVQSNVTTRIRALERELGLPLFERGSRGVSLTPAGERLLPFAVRVERLLKEAVATTRDDGTPKGRLVIGSLETTAALHLTPLLANFAHTHPQVDLALKTGTSAELVDEVLGHRLEGAFVCGPVEHRDLAQERMYREELVLLTASRFTSIASYLQAKDVRIVVLRAGCSYRLKLEAWLARRGTVGVRLLEFGTLETIIGCVEAGLGMTLLPRSLMGPVWRDRDIATHALPRGDAQVDTVFIRRRDAFTSSALDAFLALARPKPAELRAAE